MKYCAFCKRLNPGNPVYCQYCGRTFGSRICRHCREVNPPEALTCRNCGNADMSETSGPVPVWMNISYIKCLLWVFAFIFVVQLIRNMNLVLSFLIIGALWALGFQCMPQTMKKLLNVVFKYFWNLVRKK